ncbi:serine/threonine-protein kinase Nek8-like isoform X3 [Conger conger]|uniref:serine/threonine-protein kinase Nek8-like isoform X3 n=1 Tax=Conger conger TaxID=82655 RepID=UPI002A5A2EC7|nr:serine/threonine-protein kinase Nek8-like isoform X3 [Conger conger]
MGNRPSILEEHGYYEAKEIGQGAFGTVFRVKKKADEKEYVIKAVQKSESVTKEVAALKDLKHPFIVEYNDSFEDIKDLYIVMEYCEGGDLSQEIQKHKDTGGCFTEVQILNWFAEISSAVQHVHENNILHRDIMPQNIFLDKYGKIRLGDFGTAKTLERSSSCAHTNVGTFHYQSPERVEGMPYNSKSDVWALGCVLYELCELQPAFPQETMRDLFNTIVDNPTITGKCITDLQDLKRELQKKNPGDRPSTSDIMARPCILRMLCQKSRGISEELKQKLEELNEVANGFERVLMGTTVGSLTGAVVGAVGGITAIVGLCLTPVTLGASLIVSGVGIGISAAGGVTGAASNITNMVKERENRRTIENIIRELEMKIQIMLTCFQHIDSGFQSLETSRSFNLSPATRTLRSLGGLAKISSAVEMFRAAAQALKIGRAAQVVTGVFAGLFLAVDIFFIVDDSRAIHAMRQGDSTTSGEYARLEMLEEPPEEASTGQTSGAGKTQEASPDGASTGPQASGAGKTQEASPDGASTGPQASGAGKTQEASPDGASTGPQASGAGKTQEASRERKELKTWEFIKEIRKASAQIQEWLDECMPLYSAITDFEEACF